MIELGGRVSRCSDTAQETVSFFGNLDTFDLDVTIVGAVALAALLLLRRFLPKLPGSLIVVIAGVVFGSVADLSAWGIPTIGDIRRVCRASRCRSWAGRTCRRSCPVRWASSS